MSDFRNRQEVTDVYDRLSTDSGYDGRYDVEVTDGVRLLVFFGAKHTNESDDPQWPELQNKWDEFLAHDNRDKVALYENEARGIKRLDASEAIKAYGESGWVIAAARDVNVPIDWGEPDRIEEVAYLKQRFSVPQIVTYYFGRQMHQWARQDRSRQPDWQQYAREAIGHYNALHYWGGEELTLEKTLGWYQDGTGVSFDPEDLQALYDVSDPAKNEVSSASGEFRDKWLYEKIARHWKDGKDVFVVYGSGHAIVLEPALRKLAEGQV